MKISQHELDTHPLVLLVQVCYDKKCPCRIHNRCFFHGICDNQVRSN